MKIMKATDEIYLITGNVEEYAALASAAITTSQLVPDYEDLAKVAGVFKSHLSDTSQKKVDQILEEGQKEMNDAR